MFKLLFPVFTLVLLLYFANVVISFPRERNLREIQILAQPDESGYNFTDHNNTLALNWCGFQNRSSRREHSRQKRFVLHGSRWKVNPVTYNISKYPSQYVVPSDVVDQEIDAAFRMWEDVSNLTFRRERVGKVNIDIRFESRSHGDEEMFDGKGGMTGKRTQSLLAIRALILSNYLKQLKNYRVTDGRELGMADNFDADEMWTSGSPFGINLFQVATHEIGLEHTDVSQRTVMSPYYINYDKNFQMHRDDIEGIQALYGKKAYSVCDHSKIDAAVTMVDDATYLFKGNLVYKLANLSSPADPDYPKEISKVFDSLTGPLDAAFTRSNGVTYFFKGDQFWRFTNMSLDTDFPKKVSDFFPNIPTPLDAAVVFPVDENIYFMKGRLYWQFDARKSPPVSSKYPRSISEWKGMPSSIDAAVRLKENGQPVVYFFKEHQYWKFNDRSSSVYVTNPPYPRSIRPLVDGCGIRRRA